jgi:hypothetical protein
MGGDFERFAGVAEVMTKVPEARSKIWERMEQAKAESAHLNPAE